MLWPSNRICPSDGSRKPVNREMVVDLPDPLGPSNPKMVPGASAKLTSRIAGIAAKYFFSPRASSLTCIGGHLVVKGDHMSRESLGHFELLVLLALLRQGDEAYGVPIAHAIEHSTGKPVILASVYNTLERLEEKGLVRSTMGHPTAERGGRAKRYFSVTTTGLREIRAAKKALTVLW